MCAGTHNLTKFESQRSGTAMPAITATVVGQLMRVLAVDLEVGIPLAFVEVIYVCDARALVSAANRTSGRGGRYPRDHDDRHNKGAPQ
jgi:hypothetical protein